jgi:hypothetical protein
MITGILRLEDPLDPLEDLLAERLELRAAMIDGRTVDRAQDAIGHVGRAGDLQEMSAGRHGGLLEI